AAGAGCRAVTASRAGACGLRSAASACRGATLPAPRSPRPTALARQYDEVDAARLAVHARDLHAHPVPETERPPGVLADECIRLLAERVVVVLHAAHVHQAIDVHVV